jgi:uncharacterized protein (TIGR04141 family)
MRGTVPNENVKSQALTIFLIREGQTPARYLKPGLERLAVRKVGDLHYRQNPSRPPRWLAFLEDAIDKTPKLYNASNGALLTVKWGKRTFAFSFGHGRHLLQPGSWEDNFGLKVTLNSVDPGRLKSVDRKTFDAISCHTRTQASQEGDVTAFGLNIEQDLLRAATGYPLDEKLGTRMTGMDSLLVAVPTTLRGLADLLGHYLGKFHDDSYKKSFPWVDHIAEVRDPKLRDQLDDELIRMLRTEDPSDMSAWLAVPDLIEWAEIGGFRYRDTDGADLHPDLHIRDFLRTVSDPTSLSVAALRQRQVFAYGVEDDQWTKRWTVYSCLYGELERDKTTYLLTSGKWYCVERDFVAAVNADIAGLVQAPMLPGYADKSEGAYNERVASASGGKIALVDRKLIRIGGTSVEFCDLYTSQQQMIHVKKYAGSSVLSHLFAQGSVAANAFLEDAAFRFAVNAKLPASHRLLTPSQRPDPRAFEIIYAVISRSKKPVDKALPFFSRLNLRNAARQLRSFGYPVALTKIAS